jgi:hypothetical protein
VPATEGDARCAVPTLAPKLDTVLNLPQGPRASININDGAANIEVSHNVLFNWVRETGDHGPINTWDRNPYLSRTRTGGGAPSWEPGINNIHGNLIMANYHSAWCIDHDDGSSFSIDSWNLCLFGGMKVSMLEGHSKQFLNNFIFHPEYASVLDGACGFGRPVVIKDAAENKEVAARSEPGFLRSGNGVASVFRVPFCGSTCVGTGCNNQPFNNNTCFITSSTPFQYACDSAPAQDNTYYTASGEWSQQCAGKTVDLAGAQAHGHEKGSHVSRAPSSKEVVALATAFVAVIPLAPPPVRYTNY